MSFDQVSVNVNKTNIRRIRVVNKPRSRISPMVSLWVAVGVACVAYVAFRVSDSETPATHFKRSFNDIRIQWRCEQGHTFSAPGRLGEIPCQECGRAARAVDMYHCTSCSDFDFYVAVEFEPGSDGRPRIARVKPPNRDWQSVDEPVLCPRCKRPAVRLRDDPLTRRPARP